MTVFDNARRLAAWVCPGNHESAGKKKKAATRKGNIHLKTTLVQAAVCAARTKGSYYKGQVPPAEGASGGAAGYHGHRAQDPGGGVPHARQNHSFPGTRRGVPRPTGIQAHHPRPAPQQPRIRRPPPAKGRRMTLRLHRARAPPLIFGTIFGTASITASPSRWVLSRHAVLRALRQPAEKRLRAAGGLLAQSPGDQDRTLLHRFHRPCDNHRINRHKVFADLAQRGKMGWFFGFKLHLVFNNRNEIVALKLTPGNVHDTTPVPALTRELTGKLFGDKGYIGQKLAEDLLRRGLTLFTRVRKNMKSLPLSLQDKALLNARNMADIGHIKEFSSLNLSKHRSVINAFVHIIAAITAYQINPFKPKLNLQPRYQLETTA